MTNYDSNTTILMPTSIIPSHPDTRIIEETLTSIRHHFPTALIVILCDGLRSELEHRRQAYDQYLENLAIVANNYCPGVTLLLHGEHRHQTHMVKHALDNFVVTPLIVFQEHDLPVRTDVGTDWQMMADAILSDRVNLVRLMLHEQIHEAHYHLMDGMIDGLPLMKQRQFSGWTHMASADMYRRLLDGFDMRAKIMVERYVCRFIENVPWDRWRLTSYIPDPNAARRIYHLDGRGAGVERYEDRQLTYEETECYPPKL